MQRDDTIRTLHILEAARKALHFVENRTRDDLDREEMLAISLVHLLEIVGERQIVSRPIFANNTPISLGRR